MLATAAMLSNNAIVFARLRVCSSARRHFARSLSSVCAARVATDDVEKPVEAQTFVPRSEKQLDGVWREADREATSEALREAATAVTPAAIDKDGTVLLGKTLPELQALMESYNQPKFRGKQIQDAVYHGIRSIDDIKQLPKDLRAALKSDGVRSGRSILRQTVTSNDGTKKFLCQLSDGRVVETVGIPMDERNRDHLTACVSSQVGCPMRCTFCATGKGGFARNLKPHEIVDQVLTVQEQMGRRVSNVVFMGMGEPLLNIKSVVRAVEMINKDIGIGARNITISTVGVHQQIVRLAQHKLQCVLAVSIHAPTQALRETLVPSARVYPIQQLMQDCQAYFQTTSRRVTFEYTMLAGVNDGEAQAKQLAALLRSHNLASHVNLIPWNAVKDSEFKRPRRNQILKFVSCLEGAGVSVSVRAPRGTDASAACGQLRNDFQKQQLEVFEVPT